MAAGFIEAGHTVCGCARGERSIAELSKRWPAPHGFERLDVADDDQVSHWARETVRALGGVDLLINNAALINRNAPLWKISAKEFNELIDVNIGGLANVIRHFVPGMIAQGSGVIVNFSSGWGRSASADVAPYCASKGAIEGLSQALAQELPAGMAAVALNPGIIDTEMLRSCFGEGAA
jgi:NAD(P)-dependent dehydrogenase (short-subunit alcohol dehydrogenase family)